MPREVVTLVYRYDELSDDAKERAREWYREGAFHYEWWDAVYDDAKTCLALIGWEVENIYFSGFSSQGDGACFEGHWSAKHVNVEALKGHAPKDKELHEAGASLAEVAGAFPGASATVKHRGHYHHSGCTLFDVTMVEDADAPESGLEGPMEDQLIITSRRLMEWIYRQLEKAWDWLNDDEQVEEIIRANEYEFTERGRRV